MTQLNNIIISAILQVATFTLIPSIFYFFRKDKSLNFFRYIGFIKPTSKSIVLALLTSIIFLFAGVGLALVDDGVKQSFLSPNTVTGQLHLMGLNHISIITLLITALVKTSLSEELFFRGFIGKQLLNKLGFKIGNAIQAAIFGSVHLLLFFALTKSSPFLLLFIFTFSTVAGWIIGYLKDKYANGSIIPGWIAHGVGNTISYYIIAFDI